MAILYQCDRCRKGSNDKQAVTQIRIQSIPRGEIAIANKAHYDIPNSDTRDFCSSCLITLEKIFYEILPEVFPEYVIPKKDPDAKP